MNKKENSEKSEVLLKKLQKENLELKNRIESQKQSIEKLQRDADRYSTILENIEDGYYEVDIAGNFTYFNESMRKILGYFRKELLGVNNRKFMSDYTASKVYDTFNEVYRTKNPTKAFDWELIRKDGEKVSVETSITPIFDESERVIGFRGIARDITKRKKTEELLKESEEKFRNLFENSIEAVFAVDLKGNFESINKAAEVISGYSKDELIGKNSFDYIKPEFKEDVYQQYNHLFRTGEPIEDLTYVFYNKKGQERTLEGYVNVIRKEDRIIGFQGTLRDISEKKAAEEKLKASEERYRELIENIEDIVYVLDGKGNAIFFNKAVEKSLGYSRDELLKMNYRDFITPESYKYAEEIFERRLSGENVEIVEHQFISKKGEIKTIETRERFVWEGDRVVEVHGIGRDITERKKSEVALKESEEKFRILVEKVPVGILYLDNEGKIIYENPTSRMISGGEVDLSKDSSIVGLNIFDLQGIMSISGIKQITQKLLNGETVLNFTGAIETTEGKKLHIQASATPLYDLEGNQSEAIVIYSDITEKKRLEDQLLQSQKMEAVGALAGGIAHNFNNILVGIMGYSEFLLSRKSEQNHDYKALKTIHEGAIRASLLTRELLNVARRGEYRPTKINLNHVVEKTLPLITGTFDKSIEIETHLADELMLIEGDSNQLEQSLLNICINARDAMQDSGKIIIETYNQELDSEFMRTHIDTQEGDYVVLSVTDTGIGIPNDIKEYIFEPFFTTKGEKGGTGMGLSTVYGVVKNHGGVITVYSEEGEGSSFRLYFPARKGILKKTHSRKIEEKDISNATILLVDDEQVVIDTWGEFLSQQGHQVLTALDGKKALDIFKKKKDEIDLVILDYIMPQIGGKEVLINLREIDPSVKVLVASGYSENGQAKEIVAEGANGFIQKPAQLQELHTKIVEILQHSKRSN